MNPGIESVRRGPNPMRVSTRTASGGTGVLSDSFTVASVPWLEEIT